MDHPLGVRGCLASVLNPTRCDPDAGRCLPRLGDRFSAVSVLGQLIRGYRQTIFTRHPPMVAKKIGRFDEMFLEALKAQPWPGAAGNHDQTIFHC
jgi:hypothetical protein